MKDFTPNRGSHLFIGMVHLPPLPGAPNYRGGFDGVLQRAIDDARTLADGGADGVVVEDFGDIPFYPQNAPAETVAAMTAIATSLRSELAQLLIGINVLRNDGSAALSIALAADCDFVRVNILNGVRLTDQGLVEGRSHELLRDRARLHAGHIRIFADIDVKHSAPLAEQPLELQAEELLERAGADGLIVSGAATGKAASVEQLSTVHAAAAGRPVLVGSGVSLANLDRQAPYANGFIVGTSLKEDGHVAHPVDARRVERFAQAIALL